MTINYINNIPFATHNPSSDQPNMQINNSAINQIIGVDHVSFNASNGGFHNHVTFPGPQLDPSLTAGQSQIYPKSFGAPTSYLENYYEFSDSGSVTHPAYIPAIKAMVSVVGGAGPYPQTLSIPANSLQVNIGSVIQNPATVITVNFTTALPYNTYFVFLDPLTQTVGLSITRNTNSIVFTLIAGWNAKNLVFMIV